MRSRTLGAFVTAAGLIAAGGVQAMAQGASNIKTVSIRLDPARTEISFTAGLFRRVHGTFALKSGVFALDTASGIAQGEILADAASEKSNNKGMDQRIQNDTLQVQTYPGIFFHAEKVSGSLPTANGESHLKLEGSLNIHGGDHPLTVDVDAVRQGSDVLLKTDFTVPYVSWGMKAAGTMWMHDRDVRVTVVSHGTLEAPHTQG